MNNSPMIDPIEEMEQAIMKGVQDNTIKKFIPTGVLEPAIGVVGSDNFEIILLQCGNKLGKTALAVNIIKNIAFEPDLEYFDFPLYREWIYPKAWRIISETGNVGISGAIPEEIEKWWPSARYTAEKAGKTYYSQYKTDTGFSFALMTYNQEPREFEFNLLGGTWLDEPCPIKLMGAITSRLSEGGILLITATPLRMGALLDTVNDFEEKGVKVRRIFGSMYDNDKDTGKLNSRGTKRGLLSKKQIDKNIAKIPVHEREARVYGIATNKSGKVLPMFNNNYSGDIANDPHVRHFDLRSDYAKTWNCYRVMDPHRKGFPFIQWWALTPDEKHICYNEWPNRKIIGDSYYDEVRHTTVCTYTPEQISAFIKILDGTQLGLNIVGGFMDPWFAKGTENEFGRDTGGIQEDYAIQGIKFDLPQAGEVYRQIPKLHELLAYDNTMLINQHNEPSMFVMPHCVNTRRCFDRVYWSDHNETIDDTFKDAFTCVLFYLAGITGKSWFDPKIKAAGAKVFSLPIEESSDYLGAMKHIPLG